MHADPSTLNRDQFIFRDCVIGGDECVLIFPSHIAVDWTPEILHFRSIILRKSDNRVVSMGHRKWFNNSEKPHLYPDPLQFHDWRISTKLDGSLICTSRHRDAFIVRTRGTTDIDIYETGTEVRALLDQFPQLRGEGPDGAMVKDILYSNTLLWEHCTPANRIVIAYDKPSLTLLDVISHETCDYWTAKQVDQLALVLGCARPDTHTFGSLDEIVETLKTLKGIEGYVLAYNGNRNRVKLKGLDYLVRHRMKSEMSTLSRVLDFWFTFPEPLTLEGFFAEVEKVCDHETAISAMPHLMKVVSAHDQVERGLSMTRFLVEKIKHLSRRDAALDIQARHVKHYQPAAFTFLSGKDVDVKQRRRLMEHHLEAA